MNVPHLFAWAIAQIGGTFLCTTKEGFPPLVGSLQRSSQRIEAPSLGFGSVPCYYLYLPFTPESQLLTAKDRLKQEEVEYEIYWIDTLFFHGAPCYRKALVTPIEGGNQ